MIETQTRKSYTKPVLAKLNSLKEITFTCPAWQCSVIVPPPPPPAP